MRKITLLFLLVICGLLAAQTPSKPSIDELHNRKWTFIVEKAKLTTDEAERIMPIFMEYENTIWKIAEINRDFYKEFYQKKNNKGEADYQEMNDRYINSEIQKTHLLKAYYSKLKKQLSSESIFKYFNAERSFRKELINNWHGKQKESNR